jgi:hypothetical protein
MLRKVNVTDKMMMDEILEFVGKDEESGVNQFLGCEIDKFYDDLFD